jgi:WD40 repeat protein
LWGFESNECLKTFSLTSSVLSVIKAPNNKIICGFFDGTIKILDIESGKCLVTIKEHFEAIQNLKLISNEKFITCSNDKTIKLFDLNTFECIRTFIGHKRSVKGIDKISDH